MWAWSTDQQVWEDGRALPFGWGGGGRYHGWGLGLGVGVEVVAPLIAVSRAIIQISRLVKVKE